MSDICAAELDALSPFELELVARALQLRQPLTASALSARLLSLSAQQQSTQLVSCEVRSSTRDAPKWLDGEGD